LARAVQVTASYPGASADTLARTVATPSAGRFPGIGPRAVVGAFTILAAASISLNNLSLFGLVLAVGIRVDDAIVVVENVERNIRDGMSPAEAAHHTMDEVGGALIAIALTLCAVFVPSAFISGISGLFFRQFAVTISASTVISCFVSLTLSPALC